MSQNENEPPKENPEANSQQEQKPEEEPQIDLSKETPIKRIFHYERVVKYYKDQIPPSNSRNYADKEFPPIIDSLYDNSDKSVEGQDKINVQEIDWKKASELFPNLTLFPDKKLKLDNNDSEFIDFKIDFKHNKGELFNNYTHFFHAISLMASIPGLIENIFATDIEDKSKPEFYELYVYVNGEYQKVILDEYLPVVKGTTTLRFSKPNKEEIWLPLLEKAYAKTHGGYGSLITCDASSVFQCFTGVPVERINLFDLDTEDLKIVIKNNLENFIFLIPNDQKCKDIGISPGKAYQLKDIFDLGTNKDDKSNKNDNKDNKNNKDNKENTDNKDNKENSDNNKDDNNEDNEVKSNIILKLYNMFEYKQYKGKWSSEGDLFTNEIKTKVNFNPEDKNHIYMSLEYIRKFFKQIHIVYKIFDCNIKQITVTNESINIPQVFNLYIPNDSKVSFSLIFRDPPANKSKMYEYEQNLKKKKKKIPACICISGYNLEEKNFINFDGCYNSQNEPETTRNLSAGFYLVWTFLAYDFCSNPTPKEYDLKVCCHENFKLRLQALDTKYHLLKNILYSGLKQYQGEYIKDDEICFMEDNYYNFTGLGFQLISNPFKDYFQKWVFKTQVENIALLYPYSKFEHFEVQVLPEKYFLLVGIKIDNTKKCKFSMKYFFKTLKFDEKLTEKPEDIQINFNEFCSNEVQNDEIDFNYYEYLNDDLIKKEREKFNPDKVVFERFCKDYKPYMDKINELKPLNQKIENKLRFFEKNGIEDVYIGQVNEKEKKYGRGALIRNNGNYFVGYWKDDKMNGQGYEYNKNGEEICSGEYKSGALNGQGKKIYEDGTRYEGAFLDGKEDGMGIYYFKDGTNWKGNSKNGLKNGKGTFTDAQGNKSDMEYKNNQRV